MGFFVSHLLFWAVVDAIFQPGVIHLKVVDAPTIVYDRNDKSWAIPAYDNSKRLIIKTDRCLRYEIASCITGEKKWKDGK